MPCLSFQQVLFDNNENLNPNNKQRDYFRNYNKDFHSNVIIYFRVNNQ